MDRQILDEIVITTTDYDAVLTLYYTGVRVMLYPPYGYELLYTEHIAFADYPDMTTSLTLFYNLKYAECRHLVDGLLADGAAGQAVMS